MPLVNDNRADRAALLLMTSDYSISDLFTDLIALCDHSGYDYEQIISTSRQRFKEQVNRYDGYCECGEHAFLRDSPVCRECEIDLVLADYPDETELK